MHDIWLFESCGMGFVRHQAKTSVVLFRRQVSGAELRCEDHPKESGWWCIRLMTSDFGEDIAGGDQYAREAKTTLVGIGRAEDEFEVPPSVVLVHLHAPSVE